MCHWLCQCSEIVAFSALAEPVAHFFNRLLTRISHNTGEMDDRVPLLACPAVHGKLRENTAGQASSGTLRREMRAKDLIREYGTAHSAMGRTDFNPFSAGALHLAEHEGTE